MDETVLPPSPNWFQVSGLAVTSDGWIVYGGPSKSLCLLEPLPEDHKGVLQGPRYHAHVFNRVTPEKIVSVDISPEWPEKRTFISGSADGSVKQWSVEKLLQSSKVKPTLSHEIHSQEKEEVIGVSYSNEVYAVTVGGFGNVVKWDLTSNIVSTYTHIRNFKPLCMACSPHIPLNVAVGTKQGVVFVLDLNGTGKVVYKVRGQDDEIINISWCPQYEVTLKKALKESEKRPQKEIPKSPEAPEQVKEVLDVSAVNKNLPNDSFDATTIEDVVSEDDMFDIYKDHEADEFGHKKFEPEDIIVRVKEETKQDDFLAECLKLKEDIMKRKQGESSMQSLVDALENTHVDSNENESRPGSSKSEDNKKDSDEKRIEASVHIQKHLLASVGKFGGVRIWSKSGKLVASCALSSNANKNQKAKPTNWPTVLWYKPDTLLIADGKSQLVEVNPLKTDCKNKLDWNVVHALHKRGLYCIASTAPRVQTGTESDDWTVYTSSQDRNIIQYSLKERQKISVISTCGGFIYTVLPCPYDADKVAISVGDGAVRVWETSTVDDDDTKLSVGHVTSYWQNVQGKVLTIAWHPTRENLLAFATAESRIGLIDTSSKSEKPAKVLIPALSGAIYSICWGEEHDLYACGNGELVVYKANKLDEAPTPLSVEVDNHKWEVSSVRWYAHALVCSSAAGAVAVLEPQQPHQVLAATVVFSKMIYMVDWHPQQTSNSNEESSFKNLLATCSSEKQSHIVILEYVDKEGGGKQLQTYKTLTGHRLPVFQLQWNPHIDGVLLSTSQDNTVRVWDVRTGLCTSVFGGHGGACLGGAWAARPALAKTVLSGAGDCALRLWDTRDHPPGDYDAVKHNVLTFKEKNKLRREERKGRKAKKPAEEQKPPTPSNTEDHVAVKHSSQSRGPKKFLLPLVCRPDSNECLLHAAKIVFKKYLEKSPLDTDVKGKLSKEIDSQEKIFIETRQGESSSEDESLNEVNHFDFEYLKIFGSNNEVNELLDKQMEYHETLKNHEAWIMLAVFRGHIDAMIQYAAARDLLCPYLLSIAPCVSHKYWKDATQLYLAQIDRQMAKGDHKKIEESLWYGGPVFRKAAALLSVHDARAAAAALAAAHLYKEAYLLCRTRYMDSIAQEILTEWANERSKNGLYRDAAIFYIVLGNLREAAKMLGLTEDNECLALAADIAKVSGQKMLAEHYSEKREIIKNSGSSDKTEEMLEQLPSRVELLMKEDKLNGESNGHDVEVNGSVTNE